MSLGKCVARSSRLHTTHKSCIEHTRHAIPWHCQVILVATSRVCLSWPYFHVVLGLDGLCTLILICQAFDIDIRDENTGTFPKAEVWRSVRAGHLRGKGRVYGIICRTTLFPVNDWKQWFKEWLCLFFSDLSIIRADIFIVLMMRIIVWSRG